MLCARIWRNGGIKRKPEEEENEKRKKKKQEEGVEALKEELKQPINSHQNSDDDDSFFTGFVDTHLLDIDIESIYNCCLDKSSEKDWRTLHIHLICLWEMCSVLSAFVNSFDNNSLFMGFLISWSVCYFITLFSKTKRYVLF